MLWFCLLLSSIAGGSLISCWLICQSQRTCCRDRSAQIGAESLKNSVLISQTASECCSMLVSLEDHKAQLHNRLAMLEQMIENSDREIERLQEQLVRMDRLRSHPLSDTGRDMLTLLRAGGYDDEEIEHLTLRERDELDDAA